MADKITKSKDIGPTQCDHCGRAIDDEYPTNYHVRMTDEDVWAVHVDCYPEWQVEMLKSQFQQELEDDAVDEQTLINLQVEGERLERAVMAHQKLLAMIEQCKAQLASELPN